MTSVNVALLTLSLSEGAYTALVWVYMYACVCACVCVYICVAQVDVFCNCFFIYAPTLHMQKQIYCTWYFFAFLTLYFFPWTHTHLSWLDFAVNDWRSVKQTFYFLLAFLYFTLFYAFVCFVAAFVLASCSQQVLMTAITYTTWRLWCVQIENF